MSHEFYIYLLIDPRTDKVFYVGKGKGNRMYEHKTEALKKRHYNKHLENTILKILSLGLTVKYSKVFISESEADCFIKEIETILFFGLDNLCNLTEGGEGSSGYKHTDIALEKMRENAFKRNWVGEKNPNYGGGHWTEETKKRFSEFQKLSMLGEKNPFFGKKHNDASRSKMSEFHSGKILTETHKKKISDNNAFKGKKRPDHSVKMSGENNPKAKLTLEKVIAIRTKYKSGTTSYSKLANEYKVDKSTIADIIKENIWRT
jgi:hypothetical protein